MPGRAGALYRDIIQAAAHIIAPAAFLGNFSNRERALRAHSAIWPIPNAAQPIAPDGGFAVAFFFGLCDPALAQRASASMRPKAQQPVMRGRSTGSDINIFHASKFSQISARRKGLFCAPILGKFNAAMKGMSDGGEAKNIAGGR